MLDFARKFLLAVGATGMIVMSLVTKPTDPVNQGSATAGLALLASIAASQLIKKN